MRQNLSPLSTSSRRRFALGLALLASSATAYAEPRQDRGEADRHAVVEAIGDFLRWLIAGGGPGEGPVAAFTFGNDGGESEVDTEIEVDPPNPPQR